MKAQKIKLLLIEANPDDARRLQAYLYEDDLLDFKVHQAGTLQAGLASLAEHIPDIILADLGLPDSQGLDTFTQLHTTAPQVPIVVLTGLNDMQQAALAVKAGAQDYLTKDEVNSSFLRRAVCFAIERKQAGEDLRASEEKFCALFYNSKAIMLLIDPENSAILDANLAASTFYGWNLDELIQKRVSDINLLSEAEIIEEMKKAVAEKRNSFQFKHRLASGEVRDVEVFSSPISNQGKTLLYSIINDITERKKADEALRDSREKYRSLFENILDGFALHEIVMDENGALINYIFLEVNNAFENQTGLIRAEIIGKKVTEVLPGIEKDPANWIGVYGKVALTSEEIRFEQYSEQLKKWYSVLAYSPRKNYFATIFIDITERKQAELDLSESEQLYRLLIENAPTVAWKTNQEGIITFISDNVEKVYGYTSNQIIQNGSALWFDRIHPDDKDRVKEGFDTFFSEGIPFEVIYRIQRKDGEWIWLLDRANIVKEENGVHFAYGAFSNITDSKQAEFDMQTSHSLLQATLESTAEGILVVDLQGRISLTNAKFAELWGIPQVVLDTHDDHAALNYVLEKLKEPEVFIKKVQELYATPASESFDVLDFKDGRIFERVSRPQTQGTAIVGRVWSFRDVTERKQAEKLLLESEAKYRSLFDNVPDGVYRTTPDGQILAVNQALVSMLGYATEAELIKDNAKQMYPKDGRRQFVEEMKKFGIVKNLEVLMRTAQGKPLVGLENARTILDKNGEVLYYEGTLTDITELKQIEKERQTLLEIMKGLTTTDDLHAYLEIVHQAIGKVVFAKNFFVTLKNKETGLFEEPYFVDELDQPGVSYEMGKSLSAYVFRSGKPYLSDQESFNELVAQGEVEMIGSESASWLGVPLIVSRETIGVMVVQDYESMGRYSKHDVEFLASISGQVAQAIRRKAAEAELAYLFEVEQRRSQRMADLQILSAELNSLHSEQELLERLVCKAALLSNSPVCTVMLLDDKTDEIILAAHYGLPASVPKSLRIPVGILPETARAFQSGKTILISNIDQEMPSMRNVLVHPDVQAFFAFPLVLDGIVAGAITLSSLQPRYPSEAEINTYQLLARLASSALENVRLFEGINRNLERMGSLRRVDMAISASFDLVLTLNILLEQVTTHLGVDAADILVFDQTDSTLKYTCGRGFRSQALRFTNLRIGEGYAGKAALERRSIHVPNLKDEMDELEKSISLPSEEFVSYWSVPLLAKGNIQGVLEVFHRQPISVDQDWINFMEILAGQAAIAIDNVLLFNHLERSNADLSMAYDSTLIGWATALELRDNETEGHTRRVAVTTTQLASRMGVHDQEIMFIRWGSLLHDIGKMGIPDSILLKPGPLSAEEWVTMRRHPELAYEMLSPISYLGKALDIPYSHHEKWDGSGYPRGLKGEQIPLSARIFAIVDVWDALTSDRPYRPAWTTEKTMKYIQEQVGTHFDPQVLEAFLDMIGPDGKLPGA